MFTSNNRYRVAEYIYYISFSVSVAMMIEFSQGRTCANLGCLS